MSSKKTFCRKSTLSQGRKTNKELHQHLNCEMHWENQFNKKPRCCSVAGNQSQCMDVMAVQRSSLKRWPCCLLVVPRSLTILREESFCDLTRQLASGTFSSGCEKCIFLKIRKHLWRCSIPNYTHILILSQFQGAALQHPSLFPLLSSYGICLSGKCPHLAYTISSVLSSPVFWYLLWQSFKDFCFLFCCSPCSPTHMHSYTISFPPLYSILFFPSPSHRQR